MPACIYINSLITGDNADALPLIFISGVFARFAFPYFNTPKSGGLAGLCPAGLLLVLVNTVYNFDL